MSGPVHGGQADDYYGGGPEYGSQQQQYAMNNNPNQGYPPQDQGYSQEPAYPPQSYGNNQKQDYHSSHQHKVERRGKYQEQAPPSYDATYGANAPQPGMENNYTFDQAFKLEKPKWNDLWAGILLILVFLGFAAVSGIALHGYSEFSSFNGDGIYNNRNTFGLNTNTVVLFAFVVAMALIMAWAYLLMARAFTKQFIWITGILNIIFGFATAIYMLVRGYYSGGIVFLLFAVFTVICFISWIPRIPFSVLMFQTTVDVSKKYGHVYMASLIGSLVATGFAAWYAITLVAIYAKYEPGNASSGFNPACSNGNGGCSSGKVIGLIVFITFAMYWISEWLKNTIHVTISGVYGSWYFCSQNFPKGATRGAFKRAMTYSFGSISFGSLIVAIINMIRQAVSIAQNQARADGNMIGACLFCCLQCIIGCLEWAVEFVNRYAFSHIALYGKAYIPAAKDTWKMIKDRGIDALINECLIGPVMTMGATIIGFACALLAYLYLLFTSPAYNANGDFTPVVVAFAFLIGLQVTNILTTPLSSGLDTIFVAAAWDPEVMMRDHSQLYSEMVRVYPHVQQAIHT